MSSSPAADEIVPGRRVHVSDPIVHAYLAKTIAACPAENLLNLQVDDAGPGWLTLSLKAPADHCAPSSGRAGELCLLADAALGRAIMSDLSADMSCRTVDLRLDFTGAGARQGEVLHAVGEQVSIMGRFATATAEITDVNHELLATATCQLAIVELPGTGNQPAAGVAERLAGGVAHHSLAAFDADLARLPDTGDHIEAQVLPGLDMANTSMIVHGGVQAMICDRAAGYLIGLQAAGRAYGLLSLNLQFYRAAPIKQLLTVSARITKLGRLVAIADVKIKADSRVVVSAVATYGYRSMAD